MQDTLSCSPTAPPLAQLPPGALRDVMPRTLSAGCMGTSGHGEGGHPISRLIGTARQLSACACAGWPGPFPALPLQGCREATSCRPLQTVRLGLCACLSSDHRGCAPPWLAVFASLSQIGRRKCLVFTGGASNLQLQPTTLEIDAGDCLGSCILPTVLDCRSGTCHSKQPCASVVSVLPAALQAAQTSSTLSTRRRDCAPGSSTSTRGSRLAGARSTS